MAAFPTTDPAGEHLNPISNGRVIIVYNLDVDWSYRLALRYARRKRIPTANLFGWPFGTYFAWQPTNWDDIHNLTAQIAALWTSIDAQCVLTAPGCPSYVQVTGVDVWTDISTYVGWNGSAIGYPPLDLLVAGAKLAENRYAIDGATGQIGARLVFGSNYSWAVRQASTNVYPIFIGYPNYFLRGTGITSSWDTTYFPVYNRGPGIADPGIHLATDTTLDLLGTSGNVVLPGGRIGFWWGIGEAYASHTANPSGWYPFNEEHQARCMEQGLRYSEAAAPGQRYKYRTHFQFKNTAELKSLTYQCYLMDQWGYNVSYVWRENLTAETGGLNNWDPSNWAPESGGAYTVTELTSGKLKDYPFHLMLGEADNFEMFQKQYREAWTPDGGASAFLAPSDGYAYGLSALDQQGAGTFSNGHHITNASYPHQTEILYYLLRGMTITEAAYYSFCYTDEQFQGGNLLTPTGDPLMRPFPV